MSSDRFLYDPRITVFQSPGKHVPVSLAWGWYVELRIDDDVPLTFGPKRTRLGARRVGANFLAQYETDGR